MADVKKTIEVLFKATDEMSGVMGSIGSKMSGLSDNVKTATQPLADMTVAIGKIDVALGLLTAGGIALSIIAAGKFGDSFAEISTLIGDTGSKVGDFEKDILQYASNSTASIDDINKSIYTAISAGISYEDSLKALTQTEQLSVAGKADLESSTRVLISSLNAYGVSVDEAEAFSDALFTTVKVGQTTLPELANSLAQVSTIAAKSGVSFDELLAGIAAVTATGAPTTLAITSIKAAIAAIVKPSSEASKAAGLLGIKFDASALASKGLDGVLKDVYAATGGATDKITELFGSVESLPAVLTLGADTSGKFAEAMEAMKTKAGATAEAYEKMADNMSLTNQNLANNVKIVLISIGQKILDDYGDLASSVSDIFKAIGTSVNAGDFDPLIDLIKEVMGSMTDTFSGIADALPEALAGIDWSKLITALEGLGGSIGDVFKDLFGNLDLTKAEDLETVLQTIVDGIAELVKVTSGIVLGLKPFIELLGDAATKLKEMSPEDIADLTGKILGFGTAINILASVGSGLGGILTAISGALSSLALLKLSGITTSLGSLGGALGFLKGLGAIGVAVTVGLVGAEAIYKLFPGLKETDKAAFKWTVDALVSLKWEVFDKPGKIFADWVATLIVGPKVVPKMDADAMDGVEDYLREHPILFSVEPNMDPGAMDGVDKYFEDHPIDFSIKPQMDPNAFDGIEDFIGEIETAFSEIDTGIPAGMDPGTMDGIEDFMGDLDDILEADRVELGVEVDDKSIDDTKKKIQQSFKPASMGPIGLEFNVDDGVGPVHDEFSNHFRDNPIPAEDLFDPAGLSSLFEALSGAKSFSARALVEKAITQQLKIQRDLANIQKAAATQMYQAAYIMQSSSEVSEGTIRIDASGVEPEIEAFMYKILKKIQVRANESGSEFLLAAAA